LNLEVPAFPSGYLYTDMLCRWQVLASGSVSGKVNVLREGEYMADMANEVSVVVRVEGNEVIVADRPYREEPGFLAKEALALVAHVAMKGAGAEPPDAFVVDGVEVRPGLRTLNALWGPLGKQTDLMKVKECDICPLLAVCEVQPMRMHVPIGWSDVSDAYFSHLLAGEDPLMVMGEMLLLEGLTGAYTVYARSLKRSSVFTMLLNIADPFTDTHNLFSGFMQNLEPVMEEVGQEETALLLRSAISVLTLDPHVPPVEEYPDPTRVREGLKGYAVLRGDAVLPSERFWIALLGEEGREVARMMEDLAGEVMRP